MMAAPAAEKLPRLLVVGSTNGAKIRAVEYAIQDVWKNIEVKGVAVESGVSAQPWGDAETRKGARQRALAAWQHGKEEANLVHLGVGLEGGVYEDGDELWSTVWVAVTDGQEYWEANGARIRIPDQVAQGIREGQEMGDVMAKIVKKHDVKSTTGMMGIITKDIVNRTREYGGLARLALGLWYGRNWVGQYDAESTRI
jgi:inosine/xanthosine triphosphatase